MPDIFPATKSLISDITGFPNGDGGSLINFFNSVVASLLLTLNNIVQRKSLISPSLGKNPLVTVYFNSTMQLQVEL
jgi:hypothetical protein